MTHPPAPPPPATARDGRHDFDFLFGAWSVKNERLAKRLQGCQEWHSFPATQEAGSILGGLGNMDCFRTTLPDGRELEGRTIRVFHPGDRAWSIYWVDNLNCRMFPPVVGRFEGPEGTFYGDDTCEGQPVRVRFRWRVLSEREATWDQAFSPDGGESWETNWIMRLERATAVGA